MLRIAVDQVCNRLAFSRSWAFHLLLFFFAVTDLRLWWEIYKSRSTNVPCHCWQYPHLLHSWSTLCRLVLPHIDVRTFRFACSISTDESRNWKGWPHQRPTAEFAEAGSSPVAMLLQSSTVFRGLCWELTESCHTGSRASTGGASEPGLAADLQS